jgi:hypothetical protein
MTHEKMAYLENIVYCGIVDCFIVFLFSLVIDILVDNP